MLELRFLLVPDGFGPLESPGPVGWKFFPWKEAVGGLRVIPLASSVNVTSLVQSKTLTLRAYPRIPTTSDKDVILEMADKFPVVSFDPRAGHFRTDYVVVGPILGLKPSVKADGNIELLMSPRVSGLELISGHYAAPSTRTTDVRLRLRSGDTVVLDGLITEDDVQSCGRTPLLAELPHLRRIYSHPPGHRIVVLLTPHIMK